MSFKSAEVSQETIHEMGTDRIRYVKPVAKSSLFKATSLLIDSFFEKSNQFNDRVPRYLAGARSDK